MPATPTEPGTDNIVRAPVALPQPLQFSEIKGPEHVRDDSPDQFRVNYNMQVTLPTGDDHKPYDSTLVQGVGTIINRARKENLFSYGAVQGPEEVRNDAKELTGYRWNITFSFLEAKRSPASRAAKIDATRMEMTKRAIERHVEGGIQIT